MSSSPDTGYAEEWDEYAEPEVDSAMPGRPRRQFLTRWSALLLAVLLGAVGFFVGIRVEKGQLASSSSGGSSALSSLASRFRGLAGAGASSSGGSSATGTSRFGGFGGGAGATIGTVASVNGSTIYVNETGGNTVKVKLTGATAISKSESVGKSKLNPGDSVVIQGASSAGTVTATAVTDSGNRSGGTSGGSSSTGSTSAGSGGGAALSQLFGG